jgi:hypothetical protein
MITDFERTVKRFALKYTHATPMELIDRTLVVILNRSLK